MNTAQAIKIFTSLIEGVHPDTGETLPPRSVVHDPQILRALLLGVKVLRDADARASRRAFLPKKVGERWTPEDERQLSESFVAGDALSVIAEKLGCTLRAIEARLERLGLLTAEQRKTQDSYRLVND